MADHTRGINLGDKICGAESCRQPLDLGGWHEHLHTIADIVHDRPVSDGSHHIATPERCQPCTQPADRVHEIVEQPIS